jgi:hypothetical protein
VARLRHPVYLQLHPNLLLGQAKKKPGGVSADWLSLAYYTYRNGEAG